MGSFNQAMIRSMSFEEQLKYAPHLIESEEFIEELASQADLLDTLSENGIDADHISVQAVFDEKETQETYLENLEAVFLEFFDCDDWGSHEKLKENIEKTEEVTKLHAQQDTLSDVIFKLDDMDGMSDAEQLEHYKQWHGYIKQDLKEVDKKLGL